MLATALVGMGVAHQLPGPARTMRAIIPPGLRGRGVLSPAALVTITGWCEIAGGVGLLVPATRRTAGAALLLFYAAVFPANVYAARHPDRFGPVAVPLVPRSAFQVLLAGLTAFAASGPRAEWSLPPGAGIRRTAGRPR